MICSWKTRWYIGYNSITKAFILHPVIRVNATQLPIFRLRNKKELDSIVEELSALADTKTILEIYHAATAEDCNFLYVDLMTRIFMKCFKEKTFRQVFK